MIPSLGWRGGVNVADVIEHVAFELDRCPVDIVRPGADAFLREARLAVIWVAVEVTGLGVTAVSRALGRHYATGHEWLHRARFLRQHDADFARLTDLAVATLRAADAVELAA